MDNSKIGVSKSILIVIYLYLALPFLIFVLGWCKWYIGIPVAASILWGIWASVKEHGNTKVCYSFTQNDRFKIAVICVVVILWVVLSGVGNYAWQNSDHTVRNAIYENMVTYPWPVEKEMFINEQSQNVMLTYYIGYWLPAALVGKLFGIQAGYAMQLVWAVLGILIMYALICIWRKKITLWPLILFIFFSGLDIIGTMFMENSEIFGDAHLEAWSWYYQYSCNTTQLFWVFNQAIPAWVASVFLFLYEKPKNVIFIVSMLIINSIFPFVGIIPFSIYYMIHRAEWPTKIKKPWELLKCCWKNWGSVQNVLAGGSIGIISCLYCLGNNIMGKTLAAVGDKLLLLIPIALVGSIIAFWVFTYIAMRFGKKLLKLIPILFVVIVIWRVNSLNYNDWQPEPFLWFNLTLFYFLEAGVFLVCVYHIVEDKVLFWINALALYIIPTIYVGNSCDFCMRASIPGLLLITLWCIQAIAEDKNKLKVYILTALLLLGAVTPLHEIKRSYFNSRNYYENTTITEDILYQSNNFIGDADGFFGKYIAR